MAIHMQTHYALVPFPLGCALKRTPHAMVLFIISARAENMAYREAAHRRKRKEHHPGNIPPAANMLLGG